MESYEPNKSFEYDKVTLENPRPVQGGSYFTKMTMEPNKLVYIQFPKCHTKQGIIATKRGKYCDLMYERIDENELMEWIENFESKCYDLIDAKKNLWFQSDLSRDDIESMMSPICRLYKSGKKLLIRINIDGNKQTGKDKCIVYDEREILVDLEAVNDERMVIPLVHIDGIKFTSRSFEIEMKLVQAMVLDSVPELTQSCMIKRTSALPVKIDVSIPSNKHNPNPDDSDDSDELEDQPVIEVEQPVVEVEQPVVEQHVVEDKSAYVENEHVVEEKQHAVKQEQLENDNLSNKEDNSNKAIETSISLGDLEEITNLEITNGSNDPNELKEIELDINDSENAITLKKPNEVYYEIYKSAREKAKHMRQVAIQAYLEAKEIKTKYMLSDIEDSDDESNFDIDDKETHLDLAE